MLQTQQPRSITWEAAFHHSIGQNVTCYHELNDLGLRGPEPDLFLEHFSLYGFLVLDLFLKHFYGYIPDLLSLLPLGVHGEPTEEDYIKWPTELQHEVEDFFWSRQRLLSRTPFSSMPSFERFRHMKDCYPGLISRRLRFWPTAPYRPRFDCWPFTHISNEKLITAPILSQDESHGPGPDTAVNLFPAWPFEYVPHRSSLSLVPLSASSPKRMFDGPRITALGIWAFLSPLTQDICLAGSYCETPSPNHRSTRHETGPSNATSSASASRRKAASPPDNRSSRQPCCATSWGCLME